MNLYGVRAKETVYYHLYVEADNIEEVDDEKVWNQIRNGDISDKFSENDEITNVWLDEEDYW